MGWKTGLYVRQACVKRVFSHRVNQDSFLSHRDVIVIDASLVTALLAVENESTHCLKFHAVYCMQCYSYYLLLLYDRFNGRVLGNNEEESTRARKLVR